MASYCGWITVCMPKQVSLLQTWNSASAVYQVRARNLDPSEDLLIVESE